MKHTRLELEELRNRLGDPEATVVFWSRHRADVVRARAIAAAFGNEERGEAAFQSAVLELLEQKSPSSREVVESADFARIDQWVIAVATRHVDPSSHTDRRQRREDDHAEYVAEVHDTATEDSELELSVTTAERIKIARECLLALPSDLRQDLIAVAVDGTSVTKLARRRGCSKQNMSKRVDKARRLASFAYAGIDTGEHCEEVRQLFPRAVFGVDALTLDEQERFNAHIDHCQQCRTELVRDRRAVAGASALIPLPALTVLGSSASILETLKGAWASVTGKANEAATTVHTHAAGGQWQTAKPTAAVAAVVIAVGGGGVVAKRAIDKEPAPAKKTQAAKPVKLFDALDVPPTKREKPKRKKKRAKKAAPAPAPAPVQTPTPVQQPQSAPADVGDGSSEFLPEGR